MNLLQELSKLLINENSEVNFKLTKGDAGTVKVVVKSSLGTIPETANDALKTAHYALNTPFLISGTHSEIDAALLERLTAYKGAVKECVSSIDNMMKLLELSESQKQKATTKAKSPSAAKPKETVDEEEDEEIEDEADDENNGALDVPTDATDTKPASVLQQKSDDDF